MENIQPKPLHAAMARSCFSWNDGLLPAKDVQVEINHFIKLFEVKSRKEGIVEAVQAIGYVIVEKYDIKMA